MADDESTTTTTENADENQNGDTTTDDQLGDAGQKALATERTARRAAEKAYKDSQKSIDDLTAKVKEFSDRDKSETEKSADRIKELETALAEKDSQLSKKDLDVLRTKIANREGKHVPAESLTGSTEEELIASADLLLEWRGPGSTTSTSHMRQTGLRSGAGAPPNGDTPQQKAAAALRSLRSNN